MSRHFKLLGVAAAFILCLAPPLRAGGAEARTTSANKMIELAFTSNANHNDPFNELALDVIFTDPTGVQRRVPAFWDGGKIWKVRYASPIVGIHRFRGECSDPKDAGLNGVKGSVQVEAYKGDNPLYVHGPLRVARGSRYLEHMDGTPFFWLGDTWWMGLCKRLAFPDEFKTLAADRKGKGFNVVQIVAGLYPDMPAFDERGANEAGFPWEKDYARIRPEYFDAADRRIMYLVDQGIVPCIVGAWGYHLPWLGQEKMRQHQRYLYARWGALPMVWCVAGELNLPYYKSPDFPNNGQKQTAEWEKVLAYAHSINAFGRPITAHPTGIGPLSMRGVLKDPSLLDFDMLQTPHGQMEVIGPTVTAVRFSYNAKPPMPVVNAEPSYEMLWDRTPAEVTRRVFWVCWATGIKGYTYGANGIWQLNRRDKPYGNSPWGGGYGKISWDQAMKLPGSEQAGLGKKLMSAYPWQRFEPHPEWAAWADKPASDFLSGDWIWYPEGDPATDAPIATRAFRRSFNLPANVRVYRATLAVTADDRCAVWINGKEVGSHDTWRTLARFNVLAAQLKPGRNVIAISAENVKSDVVKNPAGLIGNLSIDLNDGKQLHIATDAKWLASQTQPAGWQQPDFDDAAWKTARVAAPYGGGPWGKIDADSQSQFDVPYPFGISGEVRFVYVPTSRALLLKELKAGIRYAGFYFDPVSGEREQIGAIAADSGGTRRIDPPKTRHDWVLVLEAMK
ncbi:MAG TPA: DUF4038 domain-containing protein [Tepidisphaeraceae bacterium]|nr:DUF4038 domain-containing protein [Tepidisphaeraceae bacterium]